MKRRDEKTTYEEYHQIMQNLRERGAKAANTSEWQNIKTEADLLARSCPYFDIARFCFQIISQADAALGSTEDDED